MRTAPENSKYRRNRRYHMLRKFTLIELLIIISIIIIISGLFLPAMRSALNKAESIQCINNLKQTGLNLQMYAADHENTIPISYASSYNKPQWSLEIWGANAQLPKTVFCPSIPLVRNSKYTYGIKGEAWSTYEQNFNGNEAYRTVATTGKILLLSKLKRPSEYFFLADSIRFAGTDSGKGGYLLAPSVSIGIHLRHTNRCNLLFAAGNVAARSARQITDHLKEIPFGSNIRTALLRQTNYDVPYMF